MNILVTGSLGTVGSGLIAELRRRGHYVVSCDIQHQPDEIGFSLRTDVEVPFYARSPPTGCVMRTGWPNEYEGTKAARNFSLIVKGVWCILVVIF